MSFGEIYGWLTVLVMTAFIGVSVWAWSAGRRRTYEAAARLPLEDDDPASGGGKRL
jgi:cytochrome c oxidase cbb3-type subunit 4